MLGSLRIDFRGAIFGDARFFICEVEGGAVIRPGDAGENDEEDEDRSSAAPATG